MRIKSLEIHGFKSFADRTRFNFGDGITGIVGPNGCGKSNVIDSIRWCMGEMSAKHLRGRGMQDVIFAGSDSRGPSGMAEVTLTFHTDGNVPPMYAAYPEIAVTRRLHRDGTSEYLINRIPSRLRDITDLFLGTGVGTRAYSIIEQGRIGFIVSSKPEDRRTLIEEVAGITKFKARKKAATRRMQVTEQNLARVSDIITELERQLGSLQRQAKKAERYRRLKGELLDLDLHVATMEMLRLRAMERMQRKERTKLEARLEDSQTSIDVDEARLEAERLRLSDEEHRLQAEQEASAAIDNQLTALERDLGHWRNQIKDAQSREEHANFDVEDAKRRIEQAELEKQQLEGELLQLTSLADTDREQIASASVGVQDFQSQLAELDGKVEELRRDALEFVHDVSRQRALLSSLEQRRPQVQGRLRGASEESVEVDRRHGDARLRRDTLELRVSNGRRELADWRERYTSLEQQLVAARREFAASEQGISEISRELNQKGSRLGSLEEIARHYEGYSDGVRALLNPLEGDRPSASGGIRASVAEILEVDSQFERAVEAALGERLQYLLVDGHQTACDAIEYLRSSEAGRGGFIPQNLCTDRVNSDVPQLDGVFGRASELVRASEQNRPIIDHLLGDVIIVRDLDAALAVFGSDSAPMTVVTQDGDVLDPAGVLSGGHGGAGLLAKRREIRELTEAVEKLETEMQRRRERHETLSTHRLQIEVDIQQLDKDIRTAELEQVELSKDLEAVRDEVVRLDDRAEVLRYEREQLELELSDIDVDSEKATECVGDAEERQRDVEERIAELMELRRSRAGELDGRADALTTLKVQLASRHEKTAGSKAASERLVDSLSEYQHRIERDQATIEAAKRQATDLESRISEGEVKLDVIIGQAQTHRASLSEARARYDAERVQMIEIEQSLKEKRKDNEIVSASLVDLKMDLQKIDMERNHIVEQIVERHDIDLPRVMGDYHMREVPGAEDKARKAELDRSLKNIGPINLNAIEECQEVEARYDFLSGQRDDLASALDSLKRAIQRINRASRERFKEAFEAVNETFQKVFPRLFRGGEARLELMPHEDILEAGVDIIAQPPGKKLQSVGLLSGGEKALTATALIFAIFLIKPSPFCVLDEVDAPLDDANVGRFNEMLRGMKDLSQFIVITHNKLTMTQSDRLYGITMEEPGMTKLVAVDFDGEDQVSAA